MTTKHFSLWNVTSLAALLLAFLATTGCATTGTRVGSPAIEAITKRLIEGAELRTDIRSVTACVHYIHSLKPKAGTSAMRGVSGHGGNSPIGAELQQKFVVALSNHLNVVEFELIEASNPDLVMGNLKGLGASFGVTHVLVGEFVRREEELDVSVRLVDSESLLIVASASGFVPLRDLSDDSQDMLGKDARYGALFRPRYGLNQFESLQSEQFLDEADFVPVWNGGQSAASSYQEVAQKLSTMVPREWSGGVFTRLDSSGPAAYRLRQQELQAESAGLNLVPLEVE